MSQNPDPPVQLRLTLDAEVAPVQQLDDDEGVSPDDVFTGTTGIPSERYTACRLQNRWHVMPSRVKLPLPSEVSRLRALQEVRARLINNSILLYVSLRLLEQLNCTDFVIF